MCACKLKVVPQANASEYAYTIPIQEVHSKQSRCKFKVAFCTSQEKVNAALKPVGITVKNMAQMERLADYYDSGQATAFYKVDLWQILNAINFTPEEESKTECNLVCTY